MLSAELTMLFHFNSVRVILLVFLRNIVALFALRAS